MKSLPPGSVIGVLGSGQLGRMFTIAARRLGYRVHVLSPDADTPTGQVADVEFRADYRDTEALAAFARSVSVVTFEFENVPVEATDTAGQYADVRPAGSVLHTTQHRLREKTFLKTAGIPVTEFAAVESLDELQSAIQTIGFPAILKTAAWGYDGKGQVRINEPAEVTAAWETIGQQPAVLEAFVSFQREVSVVGARSLNGDIACYPVIANHHERHILDVSICPAPVSSQVAAAAEEIARTILTKLEVVGVLCVELFHTTDDQLLVNELAPRPHNSGHLTIDAHVTCQFEQQVRAVCGMPLGSTRMLTPAAMANLLGDLWQGGEPNWDAAANFADIKRHLYGKRDARIGRKMGHLTALATSPEEAERLAREARTSLTQ